MYEYMVWLYRFVNLCIGFFSYDCNKLHKAMHVVLGKLHACMPKPLAYLGIMHAIHMHDKNAVLGFLVNIIAIATY